MKSLNKDKYFSYKRLIVKYEDMVNNYDLWSESIVNFLPFIKGLDAIMSKLKPNYSGEMTTSRFYDNPLDYVRDANIQHGKHIRSPQPGDHKNFLTHYEIAILRDKISLISGS